MLFRSLDLMSGTASGQEEAAIQETTIAYLTEERLDVDAYTNFLERQRRQKLEYIAKYGFDDDYDTFLEKLREDENAFLERLGADFDKYNEFARAYVPRFSGGDSPLSPVTPDTPSRPGESGRDPASREGGEKPPTERPDTQDQKIGRASWRERV